jgi:hypothetical protein
MYAGKPNEELKAVGSVEYVPLKDAVYVGLGVCSRSDNSGNRNISNVKLEEAPTAK